MRANTFFLFVLKKANVPGETKRNGFELDLNETQLTLSPGHQSHTHTLIFLHGIKMHIQKFFEVFLSRETLPLLENFKIVIPQAPIRPIAMEDNAPGFSWYNPTKLETVFDLNQITSS